MVAQRIYDRGIDITSDYHDWTRIGFACASLGEQGRDAFHRISSLYPEYKREECDRKFDNCLNTGRGSVTLGTLMKLASDAGVDVNLPRGRRPLTDEQRAEKQENRMRAIRQALTEQGEWRFNTWRQRPEVKEEGQAWRCIEDRDLDTYYVRLREKGIRATKDEVKSLIFSRDFSREYDAAKEWLDSLPAWNPQTDPDYLRQFYIGHLQVNDPEYTELYAEMLRKWHVRMVEMMLGRCSENPIMPILSGSQHIGKSYFARHILPPELRDLLLEVGPSQYIDKDLMISTCETPFILLDEINFGNNAKNDAMKFLTTMNSTNQRDAYARFRVQRQRRASFVATTNERTPIRDDEGNRRYLVIDLKGTTDLKASPLPYAGAYAQAIYLLDNGFSATPTQQESQRITDHNTGYKEPDDCEEALLTFIARPERPELGQALSAGDLLKELSLRGFHGSAFSSVRIGKVMRRLNFESRTLRGQIKYLVNLVPYNLHQQEMQVDARHFNPSESPQT